MHSSTCAKFTVHTAGKLEGVWNSIILEQMIYYYRNPLYDLLSQEPQPSHPLSSESDLIFVLKNSVFFVLVVGETTTNALKCMHNPGKYQINQLHS